MSVSPVCFNIFSVLSVHTRFIIFQYLKTNGHLTNISDLVKLVGLSQPTVTFHVNQLVKAGLLKKDKVGRNIYCKVQHHRVCKTCPLA